MKSFLYKIECLTNMHVGSGDSGYSVVDNEVEKDAVLGCPIIHASGVKGALRDTVKNAETANSIFGSPTDKSGKESNSGSVKFMDACMLSRPLRVRGGDLAFIQTTTVDVLNHFIRQVKAFDCLPDELKELDKVEAEALKFGDKEFLSTVSGVRVEDEETGDLPNNFTQLELLKKLLGDNFALAKSFADYPLPVVARNKLEDKKSKNLWYEELVPHHTVFYLIVQAESKEVLDRPAESKKNQGWLSDGCLVQFGGNASVGCGYTKLTRWGGF